MAPKFNMAFFASFSRSSRIRQKIQNAKIFNIFLKTKLKKFVAYPQEDFLFIKLITNFRISLLNNFEKDF
jgi:hypothetical protein